MIIPSHVDVLIVGGGPAGATLALALKDSGLTVMVLEAASDFARPADPRALALSQGSRILLQRLGVWDAIAAPAPIETIHISQRGGFGRAVLQASECGLPALGHVVNYSALSMALHQALAANSAHYLTGATVHAVHGTPGFGVAEFSHAGQQHEVTASLLVLADGGRSLAQVRGVERHVVDYGQTAVICHVTTALPHHNTAYERFTPYGPLALLPSGAGFDLVWTAVPEEAETLLQLNDQDFLEKLHERFGDRLGAFTSAGPRASFPLSLKYARPVTAQRMALIGNAAQTMHPVAGQGFNLGLRDAWELGEAIMQVPRAEIGNAAMLAHYREGRSPDTGGSILFTDALVRLFSNDYAGLGLARGLGLAALDLLPAAKRLVARKMIFGAKG
ncbi:MAG: FAD-dependent monooxygenase [Sulfuricella denitrificans]|nr:FAD-dependent monooxygenase [Sulfuricella denitrificans]